MTTKSKVHLSDTAELARFNCERMRRNKGLTQEFIALELGVSRSFYTKLENGQKVLNLSQLERIAKVFDCEVYELLKQMKEL